MSEPAVPYGPGDEEKLKELAEHLRGRVGSISLEVQKVLSHLRDEEEETDREWVRDELRLITYALRKTANEADPGP